MKDSDIKKVSVEPRTLDAISNAELDAKIQHSYAQSAAGEERKLGDVFDDLERNLKWVCQEKCVFNIL